MIKEYMVPACSGMRIDVEGGQVVDFFAEVSGHPDESLLPGVTIDCNGSLKLKTGDTIYTNMYRPMMEFLSDDVGEHDLLHPCCRPEMYEFFYHNSIYLCIRRSMQMAVFRWRDLFQKPGIRLF